MLLQEALLARAHQSSMGRTVAEAILKRYAAIKTQDSRPESEIIEYDEGGLPK